MHDIIKEYRRQIKIFGNSVDYICVAWTVNENIFIDIKRGAFCFSYAYDRKKIYLTELSLLKWRKVINAQYK